jgi:Tol biopolymer transport system component
MKLSVGDRLGRYEILGSLGAGGMGEVYRARDLQLQRDVAVKILPPAFQGDPDRRRRFEQEARAAGSLNHPNILAVHDIGVHESSAFIVTELLDGETLRDRMAGRPLPARKALDYAMQIASGIAAGHDRGIIHRDIKPENLFVTAEGRIKILDYGLAKLVGLDGSGITETVTIDGEPRTPVIGTVTYMSPEQARGARLDHRTDIFSFGVVLYEMLAGFTPFRRGTTADTITAILQDDPPALPASVAATPALEGIVHHCLEKKPEERFQNVRDLMFDLESRAHSTGAQPVVARRRRSMSSRAVVATLATLAVLAAATIGYVTRALFVPAVPAASIPGVRAITDVVGLEESPALSPDGRSVVFTAMQGKRRHLFVRLLSGRGEPLRLTSDDADHEQPRWLPDQTAVVYFTPAGSGEVQGTIYSVPALGGASRRVIASIDGGDVGRHRRVAFFRLESERIELATCALDGSDVRTIHRFPARIRYYRYPRWSPDQQSIAYQAGDGVRWDIHVVSANGGEPRQLTSEKSVIRGLTWLPDSTGVVYSSSRASTVSYLPPLGLWVAALDQTPPKPLLPADVWYEQPDVHSNGLVSATRVQMRSDVWRFPFGPNALENVNRREPVTRQTGHVLTPAIARDGRVAYLSDSGGHANIWVKPTDGSPPRQVTFEDDPAVAVGVPIWSPDGQWIAYVSSKGNVGLEFGVWLVKPDEGGPVPLVQKGLGFAWSEDSKLLYYVEDAGQPLKRIAVPGGGTPVDVLQEPVRNVIGVHRSTVYYLVARQLIDGRPLYEIRAASLDDGSWTRITEIPASQIPSWQIANPSLSPDGKWLAQPLTDGLTTQHLGVLN